MFDPMSFLAGLLVAYAVMKFRDKLRLIRSQIKFDDYDPF